MTLRRASAVLVVVLLTALGVTVQPAGAAPAGRTTISGSWTNADPLGTNSAVQRGPVVVLVFAGASRWAGDLAGPTAFAGRGVLPPGQPILVGTIEETFTGSVAGLGSGTLRFAEVFRQDVVTGAIVIDAHVTGGSGELAAVRGTLHFVGSTDADGVGGGSYRGQLSAPPVTRPVRRSAERAR